MKKILALVFAALTVLTLTACGENGNSGAVRATDRITGEELNMTLSGVKTGQSEDGYSVLIETSLGIRELSAKFENAVTDDRDTLYLVKLTDTRAVYKMSTYEGRTVYFCLTKTGGKTYVLHDCTAIAGGVRVAFPYFVLTQDSFVSSDDTGRSEFPADTDYFSLIEYYRSLSVYSVIEGLECFELASAGSDNEEIKNALPVTVSFRVDDGGKLYIVYTPGHAVMEPVYAEEGITDGSNE